MKELKRKPQLIFGKFIAVYIAFLLISNIVFWNKIITNNTETNIPLITFIVAIFTGLYIFFSSLCIKYITKIFCIAILLLNSYTLYLMQTCNISLLNSDIIHRLPFEYLHWKIIIYLSLFGFLPSFLIFKIRILYHNIIKEVVVRLAISIVLIIVSIVLIIIQYSQISTFQKMLIENYKYLVPVNYITEVYKIQKI